VTEVLPEVVYRLLREEGFHEEKSVTQTDQRDVFAHNEAHWAFVLGWELIEICARFEEEVHDGTQFFLF
jgi:hypothetical protein